MLTLIVSDDSGGLPQNYDVCSASSLGMRTIRRLATSQLSGTLEIVFENGTTFSMRFPEVKTE